MRTDTSFPQRGFQSDRTLAPVSNRFHMLSFGASLALPLLDRNQGAVGAATASERAAGRDRAAVDSVARTGLAAAVARWSAARQAVAIYTGGLRDSSARALSPSCRRPIGWDEARLVRCSPNGGASWKLMRATRSCYAISTRLTSTSGMRWG